MSDFNFGPLVEAVEVHGRTYYVRALGLDDLLAIEQAEGGGSSAFRATLKATLCDKDGTLLGLDEAVLGSIPAPIAIELATAAQRVSGITDEEDDGEEGKAPSSTSPIS